MSVIPSPMESGVTGFVILLSKTMDISNDGPYIYRQMNFGREDSKMVPEIPDLP